VVFRFTKRFLISALESIALISLILLAGYVSMGRILISNIDSFREDIAQQMTAALNVEVSLANISGTWHYLDPQIRVEGLVIGTLDEPAVRIESASVMLDTIASIRERSVVVRQIETDGLTMALRQAEDGSWFVVGLPRSGKPFNAEPVGKSIPYLQVVNITGVDVVVSGLRQEFHLTNQATLPLMLVADGDYKMVSMPLAFRESERAIRSLELLGRFRGNPLEIDTLDADLYLHMPPLELAHFFPRSAGSKVALEELQLQGEFWLTAERNRFELRALPSISALTVSNGESRSTVVDDLSAKMLVSGTSLENLSIYVEEIEASVGSSEFSLSWLSLAMFRAQGNSEWNLAAEIPGMKLAPLTAMAREVADSLALLDDAGFEALDNLSPKGSFSEVLLTANLGTGASTFQLTTDIKDLFVGSHNGSPELSSADAFLSTTGKEGYIDIDAESLSIHFPHNFKKPWPLDTARGRIYYKASPGHIVVVSERISLTTGPLNADGRFYMSMPDERVNRTWGLEIGITDADLLDANRYLPVTLDENLIAWLERGIKRGVADSAGLLFHGALDRLSPSDAKIYELYFKVSDASLLYEPAWPVVDDLSASIYIGNWGVHSDDASGVMLGNRIEQAVVNVPQGNDVPVDTVLIQANVSGELAHGLRVLNETPVSETVNHVADGWLAEGEYRGQIRLDIPLGQRQGAPVGIDLDVLTLGNDIFMPAYDLDVKKLSGHLTYTNEAGLGGESLSATLFDRDVSARIESVLQEDGGTIEVSVDGIVDVGRLYEWSGQSILTRVVGAFPYNAVLRIPFGERAGEYTYVEARSNLKGTAIRLPAPMKKVIEDEMNLVYRQTFLDEGFRVDLQLGELTQGSFKTVDGIVKGGRFHFGTKPMGAIAYDALNVSGDLEFVDYGEWERVTEFLDQKTDVSLESAMASSLEAIDVHIKSLNAFGLELDEVDTYITRDAGAWNVALINEMLAGLIRVSDDEAKPLDVSLDYLRFHSEEGKESSDPLGGATPAEYIPANFQVRELNLDGEDYGSWSFRFRPSADGATLESFGASVKGLNVSSESTVNWVVSNGEHTSNFDGKVSVSDLGSTLEQWGFASSIEGKEFKFDAELAWPGSPAMIDLDTLKGIVNLREGEGRFVQAEANTGALKLLGIFDFASLARRFRFDFSDVVDDGFTFSKINGAASLDNGLIRVIDPIVIEGASSKFKLGGQVDLNTNMLDNDMIVTLPVSRNLPWYAAYSAIATGPLVGVSVFIAQKVFEDQIDQMSSAKYKITGTVDEPVIKFVSIFSDSVRESPADEEKKPPSKTSTGE
jgi:uncharacterized protein (TIGR02099 family)